MTDPHPIIPLFRTFSDAASTQKQHLISPCVGRLLSLAWLDGQVVRWGGQPQPRLVVQRRRRRVTRGEERGDLWGMGATGGREPEIANDAAFRTIVRLAFVLLAKDQSLRSWKLRRIRPIARDDLPSPITSTTHLDVEDKVCTD